MPPDSALKFKPFNFRGRFWHSKVYPAGFNNDTADFVAAFVKCFEGSFSPRTKISIEILDKSGEHTVFDDHTTKLEFILADGYESSKGYIKFVKRRELEASSCVHNDSFMVRCTLSVDVKVTKSLRSAAKAPTPSTTASPNYVDTTSICMLEVVTGSHTLRSAAPPRSRRRSRSASACTPSTSASAGATSTSRCTPTGTAMIARTTCPSSSLA